VGEASDGKFDEPAAASFGDGTRNERGGFKDVLRSPKLECERDVGVVGDEVEFVILGEGTGAEAVADSFRRNSTHILEKDSGSSALSRSGILEPEETRRPPREGGAFVPVPARCNPALSRSLSSHERIDEKIESISNLFPSPREVVRNWSSMLVMRRRSTVLSEEEVRRRRRASVRCSLIMTVS